MEACAGLRRAHGINAQDSVWWLFLLDVKEIIMPDQDAFINSKARDLLNQLTLDEKIHFMGADTSFWFGLADMLGGGYGSHT